MEKSKEKCPPDPQRFEEYIEIEDDKGNLIGFKLKDGTYFDFD